ncbi:unnamed protein product [Adineta steineri]|uniref:Uncharacterized protein n=1 Tax=Adineta steineri TaxID=433720 RepID=A0A813VU56_9BILA|nr:unnamed protein product [Adineta steineri]CAF1328966.1 unnamed protein product [Adineta steineri]
MSESRNPAHVALYNSSYVILFDDGSWSSRGVPESLVKKMEQTKSKIEFVSLGPNEQWFFRLENGKVVYDVDDQKLRDDLRNSVDKPFKLWFNDDDDDDDNASYILQYSDLSLSWNSIPNDFHNKLNGRQKSLPVVKNITFGPDNTWWVSFQDDTARSSSQIPRHIGTQLKHTKCLVLDPQDEDNYFIFKDNGSLTWQVNDDFDDDINEKEEDDDVVYMNPHRIRYTQKSISPRFRNGQSIEQLRQDLEDGITNVDKVPKINVIRTRSGNIWSLDNRRLWCFHNASNIDRIPVRVTDKRPSWFNNRIKNIKEPFEIRVRGSSEETEHYSDVDGSSDWSGYD